MTGQMVEFIRNGHTALGLVIAQIGFHLTVRALDGSEHGRYIHAVKPITNH